MGCANFNPGETAHRSRIFTRVEASCAVAGGENGGEGGKQAGTYGANGEEPVCHV